jgi:hypothetical protein
MLNVIMLSVIMMNAIMLGVALLNVIMLGVAMLTIIMLSVVARENCIAYFGSDEERSLCEIDTSSSIFRMPIMTTS